MADIESHDNCLLVTFERLQAMTGGELERVRCQEMWQGSLESFRAAHHGVAIVGYNQMEDGQVGASVMLNEKLQVPGQSPAAGAVTPEVVRKAEAAARDPANVPERVYRDGDSYIKTVGERVFRLGWTEYDDASAPFDRKIQVRDGRIYVTTWKELEG